MRPRPRPRPPSGPPPPAVAAIIAARQAAQRGALGGVRPPESARVLAPPAAPPPRGALRGARPPGSAQVRPPRSPAVAAAARECEAAEAVAQALGPTVDRLRSPIVRSATAAAAAARQPVASQRCDLVPFEVDECLRGRAAEEAAAAASTKAGADASVYDSAYYAISADASPEARAAPGAPRDGPRAARSHRGLPAPPGPLRPAPPRDRPGA